MEKICLIDNLQEAFLRAARGKNGKQTTQMFRANLDRELLSISTELSAGTYRFGGGYSFQIHDPKPRSIYAAPFRDRVTFHAMMRICHPVFDAFQCYDSYASRPGKGTYAALFRAQALSGRHSWFAKVDVVHFFDSIDHGILLRQLARLFKDARLLCYFRDLLDCYHSAPGKGIPIGNLTSQYFANHYLAVADHYAKEQLRIPGLVRYMDDVIIFADSREMVIKLCQRYRDYLKDNLLLNTHPPVINRTSFGIPFLGYVVYPDRLRLNLRSKRRFRDKTEDLMDNADNEDEYGKRLNALTAFVQKADVRGYVSKTYRSRGLVPQGRAPTG